jgi:hypothetical protein
MNKVVKKLWGSEIWHHNDELYCMKTLVLKTGFMSSLHWHRVKIIIPAKHKIKNTNPEGWMGGESGAPVRPEPLHYSHQYRLVPRACARHVAAGSRTRAGYR